MLESEDRVSGSSRSTETSCIPLRNSRPYVMCSASDAVSAAIDFSKDDVDEGVVDSPPSQDPIRILLHCMSPLK